MTYIELTEILLRCFFEEIFCDLQELGLEQLFVEVKCKHDVDQFCDEVSVLFLLVCAIELNKVYDAFDKSVTNTL